MEKLTKKQLKQWMEDTDLLDIDENIFNSVFVLWELNYAPKTAEDNDSYIDWVYSKHQYVLSTNVSNAYALAYIANKIEKENNIPFYKIVKTPISGAYNSDKHNIYVPYGEIRQVNYFDYDNDGIILTIIDNFNEDKNIATTETFTVDFDLLDAMKQLRSTYKSQKTR